MTKECVLSGGILEEQYLRLPNPGGHSWRELIGMEFSRDRERYIALDQALTELYQTNNVNPQQDNIFKAFQECPFDSTVLVLCGQDPYPNASHAMGLSFSIPAGVKQPPSLKNILKELESDIGPDRQVLEGDLTPWARQGVLLLNTALTVNEGEPNSHKKLWDGFAIHILSLLNEYQKRPLVFILWGNQAHDIGKHLENTVPSDAPRKFIYSVHPSPLSAYRGFFGSKPFSQTNDFLAENGVAPIKW